MLLSIHDSFRAATKRLSELSGPARRHLFHRLATTLHHHHHAEEVMLFPQVARRTGVQPEELIDDHEELMRAIDRAASALSEDADTDLGEVTQILLTHLEREEALVIPIMLEG